MLHCQDIDSWDQGPVRGKQSGRAWVANADHHATLPAYAASRRRDRSNSSMVRGRSRTIGQEQRQQPGRELDFPVPRSAYK